MDGKAKNYTERLEDALHAAFDAGLYKPLAEKAIKRGVSRGDPRAVAAQTLLEVNDMRFMEMENWVADQLQFEGNF